MKKFVGWFFCGLPHFIVAGILFLIPVKSHAAWVSLIDGTALAGITADLSTLQTFIIGIFVIIMGVGLILGIMSRGGR